MLAIIVVVALAAAIAIVALGGKSETEYLNQYAEDWLYRAHQYLEVTTSPAQPPPAEVLPSPRLRPLPKTRSAWEPPAQRSA